MSKKNNGDSAFSGLTGEHPNTTHPGMTLRDWFAGQALAALGASDVTNELVASYSYQLADAMLEERDK